MRIQNRLLPNGKFPGVRKKIKELQDRAILVCYEPHGLDKELNTIFDSKSLQELHKIFIDTSCLDKPKFLLDELQISYEQLKTCNNVVPLSSKSFEDRLIPVQIYDINSLTIQAIRMSLFHLVYLANSIQVKSSTIQNYLNMLAKDFVIESTLEICKTFHTNDANDSPVNNKALTLAHIKLLSDKNTNRNSKGNVTFFSNMYNRMKTIGFNKIGKSRIESSSSNQHLLQHIQKQNTDDDIIRRNLILKIDVNNNWLLFEKVLSYSQERQIPVLVVFNLKLNGEHSQNIENFLRSRNLQYKTHFANLDHTLASNLLIFYMAQQDLNFHLTRSQQYQPRINEINNFMMVDIVFNHSRFQIITIYGSIMSVTNEHNLYSCLSGIINNTPTIWIVQSLNGRFHTTCANSDLLELANEDLLNELEDTDGTLIYISREFPEEIRNIRVFTGRMNYRRSDHPTAAHLEAGIVVTSIPLNQ